MLGVKDLKDTKCLSVVFDFIVRVVFLHDLPESYIAVKIKLTKNVRMYVTDFFSAVFLNNKHVPNGNKTLEHLEKFWFSYLITDTKVKFYYGVSFYYCNSMKQKQTKKVNGTY